MSISIHHLPSIRLLNSTLEATSPIQKNSFTTAGGLGELFAEKDAALNSTTRLQSLPSIQLATSLRPSFEKAFEIKTRKLRPNRQVYEKNNEVAEDKKTKSMSGRARTGLARLLIKLSDIVSTDA